MAYAAWLLLTGQAEIMSETFPFPRRYRTYYVQHGLLGTVAYLGFFVYGLWRFRRDHSAIGIAGSAAIVASLVAMFWYNALVTPLAWTFCAYALLWRNDAR